MIFHAFKAAFFVQLFANDNMRKNIKFDVFQPTRVKIIENKTVLRSLATIKPYCCNSFFNLEDISEVDEKLIYNPFF